MNELDIAPRYRIEHHHPQLAPYILAFAYTEVAAEAKAILKAFRLQQAGEQGHVMAIDQSTESIVMECPIRRTWQPVPRSPADRNLRV